MAFPAEFVNAQSNEHFLHQIPKQFLATLYHTNPFTKTQTYKCSHGNCGAFIPRQDIVEHWWNAHNQALHALGTAHRRSTRMAQTGGRQVDRLMQHGGLTWDQAMRNVRAKEVVPQLEHGTTAWSLNDGLDDK